MTILDYSQTGSVDTVKSAGLYNTAAAAKALGISKATLLRWIRDGRTADVGRDRHGWREFTKADIRRIKKDVGIAA